MRNCEPWPPSADDSFSSDAEGTDCFSFETEGIDCEAAFGDDGNGALLFLCFVGDRLLLCVSGLAGLLGGGAGVGASGSVLDTASLAGVLPAAMEIRGMLVLGAKALCAADAKA